MHRVEFRSITLRPDRLLVGMAAKMSVAEDGTPALWQRFMPRRKEIQNKVDDVLFSVQKFSESDNYATFTPQSVFEKWAAVEVADESCVPDEMRLFVLQGGHYAVFDHFGPPSQFPKTLKFIFEDWMPRSEWRVDGREHFELLLPGWRPDDPDAREEVWIPVCRDRQT